MFKEEKKKEWGWERRGKGQKIADTLSPSKIIQITVTKCTAGNNFFKGKTYQESSKYLSFTE